MLLLTKHAPLSSHRSSHMLPVTIDSFVSMMLTAKQRHRLQTEWEKGHAPRWFEAWQEYELLGPDFKLQVVGRRRGRNGR